MRVEVIRNEYWEECDAIWANQNGCDEHITFDEVATATVIPSFRTDGLETLILADGRVVLVQSIDLNYL
jgi:hypothetical protein